MICALQHPVPGKKKKKPLINGSSLGYKECVFFNEDLQVPGREAGCIPSWKQLKKEYGIFWHMNERSKGL